MAGAADAAPRGLARGGVRLGLRSIGRARPRGTRGPGARPAAVRLVAGDPGHPGGGPGGAGPSKEYLTGLGEMYVSDERFAANYGGQAGAAFVRAALQAYADRNL